MLEHKASVVGGKGEKWLIHREFVRLICHRSEGLSIGRLLICPFLGCGQDLARMKPCSITADRRANDLQTSRALFDERCNHHGRACSKQRRLIFASISLGYFA